MAINRSAPFLRLICTSSSRACGHHVYSFLSPLYVIRNTPLPIVLSDTSSYQIAENLVKYFVVLKDTIRWCYNHKLRPVKFSIGNIIVWS